ncbi:hypothetical protein LSH36_40g02015 [Paralvinella palmiformis]|uniref:Ionotropic glutamate receptor C-terminal domain-containing protein n=1 Tax=Paralvinella palmiformis TaxID=53620 RepID=A0AAD9K7F3_9ANNE|nr:hypothetical protein LSH36_40g02015 [Paralvinella palmiformis]
MFVTEQRQQVVDFTEPFLEVKATVLVKRPPLGRRHVAINSAADLIGQSEYQVGTRESGMIARAFRKTNDTLYRKLWKRLRRKHQSSFTASNEEGISRARSGRYAFILPSNIAEYIARKEPCDLITIDRFLLDAHFALALPKGSGLVAQLNRALYLLEDDGFLDRLYHKWWVKKNDCNGIQYSKMYSLSSPGCCTRAAVLISVVASYVCWHITSYVMVL